jgi:hypothetical protein
MTRKLGLLGGAVALLCSLQTALAADEYDYHPALSDRFLFTLGAFSSDNNLKIAASGSVNSTERDVDFGKAAGVDEKNTVFNGQLRWQFGDAQKWSLWGQYFRNNSTGKKELDQDVEFQDVVFRQGSYAEAGVKVEVIRAFVGRSLVRNAQHDFGIGAGLHNLKITAFIGGEVLADDATLTFQEKTATSNAPLPNLGSWYNYAPSKHWLVHGRVDWMSAKVGDYSGTLWNNSVGVDYQFARNFGVDLSYQFFKINLDVDKSDWHGGVDMSYKGPVISVTANW